MFVQKIALAALFAVSAFAQESGTSSGTPSGTPSGTSSSPLPTSTDNIPACVLTCAQNSNTICAVGDTACACSSTSYQDAVRTCLQDTCSPEDLQTALGLQASACGSSSAISSISSGLSSAVSSASSRLSSASSRASSLGSSISSRLSTGSTPSSTSTGSSSGAVAGFSANLLATGGVVLLGVIGGGLLVF